MTTTARAMKSKVFLNAGGGGAKAAREALTDAGLDLQVVQPTELESRLKQEIDGGAKRIAVAGGDGTIATAATLVANKGIELAILPCGTLNHFAIDSGIPVDLDEAAKVGIGTKTITADVGYAGKRLFLNTSSIGAYVTFVRLRDRLEKRFGYRLASLLAMARVFALLRTVNVLNLAAQNGFPASKQQARSLVAYQSPRR